MHLCEQSILLAVWQRTIKKTIKYIQLYLFTFHSEQGLKKCLVWKYRANVLMWYQCKSVFQSLYSYGCMSEQVDWKKRRSVWTRKSGDQERSEVQPEETATRTVNTKEICTWNCLRFEILSAQLPSTTSGQNATCLECFSCENPLLWCKTCRKPRDQTEGLATQL